MKYVIYVMFFFAFWSLSACKKDSGISEPTELQDFSGLYRLDGTLRVLSSPVVEKPLEWIALSNDQGNGYQPGTGAGYSSSAYRWAIGEIYYWSPDLNKFRLIVYGGEYQNNMSDGRWKVSELDSIFQPGKLLSFGNNFGEVGIEFNAAGHPAGEYWSLWAENTGHQVKIEEVNDFEAYLPGRKWVKQVVVTFNVQLTRVFDSTASPDIELINCRASLLFSPPVE